MNNVLSNHLVLGFFFEEWLIFGGIVGQLVVILLFKKKLLVSKKKLFFILLTSTQGILIGCLLSNFFFLGLFYFYYDETELIFLQNSNFFFRYDWMTLGIQLSLIFITLYFLALVRFVFSKTIIQITYIVEIPMLVLTILFSLRLFSATTDLLLLLLTLELTTFCTLILIALQSVSLTTVSFPLEAALKYFSINALAMAFFLFSLTQYYLLTGTLNLTEFAIATNHQPSFYLFSAKPLLFAQIIFFFSYLIKIGAAPLHNWVPDVYEGAETLVTAFLVLLIGPAFIMKLYYFIKLMLPVWTPHTFFTFFFTLSGLGSVIVGTIMGFSQFRIKRFLAYSGITHLGFMLLGLAAQTIIGYISFFLYLIIYVVTNCVFFTLLIVCQSQLFTITAFPLIFFSQLKDYLQTSQGLLISFIISICSFAGLPPFAGFFGKFGILLTLIEQQQFGLVLLILLYVIIGVYMYLRLIKINLFETTDFTFFSGLFPTYFKINTTLVVSRRGTQPNPHVLWGLCFWFLVVLTSFVFIFPLLFIFNISSFLHCLLLV